MSLTITLQRTAYTANDSINAEAFNNQSALSASIADGGSYLFGLGSLGAPSVGFIGDADTGLYSPGADRLALVTGGVARLTVSAAGAVTIPGAITASGGLAGNVTGNVAGTLTAPLGAVGTPSVAFTGDTNTGLYSPGADQLALVTAGVARLTVSAAGAVTIPGAIIANNTDANRVLFSGTTRGIRFTHNAAGSVIEGVDNTGSASYQPLYLGGSYLAMTISGGETARLTSSGLGIGTDAPNHKMTVAGNGSFGYGIQQNATTVAAITANTATGELRHFAYTNYFPTFYSNGVEAMRIDLNGAMSLGAVTGSPRLYAYKDAAANAGLGINLAGGSDELSVFAGATTDAAGIISFGRRRVDSGTYTERAVINLATGAVRFNAYGAGVLVTDSAGNITAATALSVASLAASGAISGASVSATGNISAAGTITVNSGASPAGNVRNITISTAAPSGGADGDVWLQYTP